MPRPRQKRYRDRKENGRAVYRVEVDTVSIEYLLEAANQLPVGVEHSHSEVQAALGKFIDILIAEELTRQNSEL
jgi:hypothetical protein